LARQCRRAGGELPVDCGGVCGVDLTRTDEVVIVVYGEGLRVPLHSCCGLLVRSGVAADRARGGIAVDRGWGRVAVECLFCRGWGSGSYRSIGGSGTVTCSHGRGCADARAGNGSGVTIHADARVTWKAHFPIAAAISSLWIAGSAVPTTTTAVISWQACVVLATGPLSYLT